MHVCRQEPRSNFIFIISFFSVKYSYWRFWNSVKVLQYLIHTKAYTYLQAFWFKMAQIIFLNGRQPLLKALFVNYTCSTFQIKVNHSN